MEVRFKKKSDAVNVVVTALAALVSVGMMIYGVITLGLKETWPELVLNIFYIACLKEYKNNNNHETDTDSWQHHHGG